MKGKKYDDFIKEAIKNQEIYLLDVENMKKKIYKK